MPSASSPEGSEPGLGRSGAGFGRRINPERLRENGFELMVVPYALQLNKRDLPTAMPYDLLARSLNVKGEPTFEAVAPKGVGVFETLKAVAKQVLHELSKK